MRSPAAMPALAAGETQSGSHARVRAWGLPSVERMWTASGIGQVWAAIGELDRARSLCEKLMGHASALGLYGEELDPTTARHLGNFPQALTHLSLINAVLHVIEAEQQPGRALVGRAGSPSWWNAAGTEDRPSTITGGAP